MKNKSLLILSILLVLLLLFSGTVQVRAADLVHVYELNGNYLDELGGPALIPNGSGSLVDGGYLVPDHSSGLSLQDAIDPENYSIEILVRLDGFPNPSLCSGGDHICSSKIIDFKDRTSDNGLYTPSTSDASDGRLQLCCSIVAESPEGTIVYGETTHLVLTRDGATDEVVGYINGLPAITITDTIDMTTFDGAQNVIHFLMDDSTTIDDPPLAFINRIRIYNGPLSAEEVYKLGAPLFNTWIPRTNMPTGRGLAASAVVNDEIYVMGGWTDQDVSTVEAYDPATDSWTTKASMNTPRNNLTAAAVDGKIYAIGGWSVVSNTTAVEMYDPTTDSWSYVAPLPVGNNSLRAAVVDNKIYAIGGWDGNTITNTVMMYNPTSDAWSFRTPMPTPRSGMAVAAVDGKIYTFGGVTATTWTNKVEIYDPVLDSWSTGTNMPTARNIPAAAVYDGKIYVMGGHADVRTNVNEQYDPATDTWLSMTPMLTHRDGLVAETVGGRIYAIGGWADEGDPDINEAYIPPATNQVFLPLVLNNSN